MKKLLAILLVAMLALCLVACGDDATTDPEATATDVTEPAELFATIELGDYEGMEALSQQISNFEVNDQTVKITGIFDKTFDPSIMEDNGDGDAIGYAIEVAGWSDADYPENDTTVEIIGTVTLPEGALYPTIIVQPEDFKVIE